jgi:hypothetical protein
MSSNGELRKFWVPPEQDFIVSCVLDDGTVVWAQFDRRRDGRELTAYVNGPMAIELIGTNSERWDQHLAREAANKRGGRT